ncbi:MAG TPA: TM2 domain-containing protein [Ktedonobacterales bacterium]|nr:TM2 domain-containing protein [Ktedonobacterales bacterium]
MSVDIARLTAHLPPQQRETIQHEYRRKADGETAAFLYCFFLGIFGAHRFYLHQWSKGVARLLLPLLAVVAAASVLALSLDPTLIVVTAGPLLLIALIWMIIDLFRIDAEVAARNLKLAERLIANALLADASVERQAAAKLDTVVRETAARAQTAAGADEAATEREAASAAGAGMLAAAAVAGERAEDTLAVSSGAFDSTTLTEVSASPDAETRRHEQPYEPRTASTTESSHADEMAIDRDSVARLAAGAASIGRMDGLDSLDALDAGMADALDVSVDESVTRTQSQSGFSTTESVESYRTVGVAETAERDELAEVMPPAPPTAIEAEAATVPDLPPMTFESPESGALFGIAPRTTPDVTDRGTPLPAVPLLADVATASAVPLIIRLPETTGERPAADLYTQPEPEPPPAAGDEALLVLEPVPAGEPAPRDELANVPVVPVVPVMTELAHSTPGQGETLAELAAFAAAAGAGAGAASAQDITHHDEIEAAHYAMKRIRVVRQVRVEGQVVEEQAAEEYIEVDADPEPVKARLREQLRLRAEAAERAGGGAQA